MKPSSLVLPPPMDTPLSTTWITAFALICAMAPVPEKVSFARMSAAVTVTLVAPVGMVMTLFASTGWGMLTLSVMSPVAVRPSGSTTV